MGSWVSVVGGVLVLLVLWDVFNSLLYPTGRGRISHSVMAGVWRLTRRAGRRVRRVAGPLALVAAIGSWGVLVLLGGALVYWPHLPSSFAYGPGIGPGGGAGFVDAF
jgi:Zn-dependent protease